MLRVPLPCCWAPAASGASRAGSSEDTVPGAARRLSGPCSQPQGSERPRGWPLSRSSRFARYPAPTVPMGVDGLPRRGTMSRGMWPPRLPWAAPTPPYPPPGRFPAGTPDAHLPPAAGLSSYRPPTPPSANSPASALPLGRLLTFCPVTGGPSSCGRSPLMRGLCRRSPGEEEVADHSRLC